MDDSKQKREQKCWGSVFHLSCDPHVAISHLRVLKGTRCSKHYHRHRANQFSVLSGVIVVQEWESNLRGFTEKILRTGDSHVVHGHVVHRFRVLEDGEVIEVYWSEDGEDVEMDDIVRLDVGGKDE